MSRPPPAKSLPCLVDRVLEREEDRGGHDDLDRSAVLREGCGNLDYRLLLLVPSTFSRRRAGQHMYIYIYIYMLEREICIHVYLCVRMYIYI